MKKKIIPSFLRNDVNQPGDGVIESFIRIQNVWPPQPPSSSAHFHRHINAATSSVRHSRFLLATAKKNLLNRWNELRGERQSSNLLQNLIEIIFFFFCLPSFGFRCAGRIDGGCRQLARHEHKITPKPHRLDPTALRLPHNFRCECVCECWQEFGLTHTQHDYTLA